jgi:Putative cyclase
VISIVEQLKKDDNYHLRVADIENWEAEHGRIPEGSVVFVRSDWSKRWPDPALATTKRFPGVSLAALKFLHEQRKILFSWPRVARYRQHSDAWRNADFPPVPCWIPVKVLSLKSLRDRIEEKLQNGCAKTRHRDCQAGFGLPSIGSAPGDPSRRFVTLVSGVRASSIFSSPSWTTIFVSLSSKTGPVT